METLSQLVASLTDFADGSSLSSGGSSIIEFIGGYGDKPSDGTIFGSALPLIDLGRGAAKLVALLPKN